MKKLLLLISAFTLALASWSVTPAKAAAGTAVLFTTNDGGAKYSPYMVQFISVYVGDEKIGYTGSDGDCTVIPALGPGLHKVSYIWSNNGDPSPGTIYGEVTSYLLIPDQTSLFTVRIPTVQVKFYAQQGLNISLNQVWLGIAQGDGLLANLMSGNYTLTYVLGNKPSPPAWPMMPPFPGIPDPRLNGFTELCVGSADPYPVPVTPVEIRLPHIDSTNEPPVAEAGPAQIVEQTSSAGASVILDGSGSTDPEGDPLTYSWTWSGGSVIGVSPTVSLPPGETSIALIVKDGSLVSASDYVTITVADRTAPMPDVPNLPDITAACSIDITEMPTATDSCDGKISATTKDPLQYKAQGTFSISWTYTDKAGNHTTQTQTVKVQDVTAPAPDVPKLPDLSGACSVVIADIPTATDNCDGKIRATTKDPLQYKAQGTFSISWTYTDKAGNHTTQTQIVKVEDTKAPLVSVSGPVCVTVGKGNNKSNKITLVAEDDCSKNPVLQITKVQVFNNGGNIVNGNGIYEISGNVVYVNPNGNGWKVIITANATDENGNSVLVTITKSLIKC